MGAAKVTVVLPVRDFVPAFLDAALASIHMQTSLAWKLIVVREADTALASPLFDDPRVEVVLNEGRKLAGAINTGVRRAQTEFFALLFADDLWSPDAIEVLDAAIARFGDVDVFHSARRVINDAGDAVSSVHPARESITLDDFRAGSRVKHLLCFRRSTVLAVGGLDESLNSVGPDDHDLPWTLAEAGAVFHPLQECLYVYRDHRQGFRLTTHLPMRVHVSELRRILRKHGVTRAQTELRVLRARRGYLRQCLYASERDRREKERAGFDASAGWRDTYR